jgi:antitoxin (DNA-binding transcriptional repressor) of toxin-antitoxin stability system
MQPHGSATIPLFSELIRGMEAGEAVWLLDHGGRTARLAGVQDESGLSTNVHPVEMVPIPARPLQSFCSGQAGL